MLILYISDEKKFSRVKKNFWILAYSSKIQLLEQRVSLTHSRVNESFWGKVIMWT